METDEVLRLWVVEWSAQSHSFNIHQVHEALGKNRAAFRAHVENREVWQHWIPVGFFADEQKARDFCGQLFKARNDDIDAREKREEQLSQRDADARRAEIEREHHNQMRREIGLPPLEPDDE